MGVDSSVIPLPRVDGQESILKFAGVGPGDITGLSRFASNGVTMCYFCSAENAGTIYTSECDSRVLS